MPYSKEESMTYASLQQPLPLAQEGNLATNWREWKSAFDYFLIASGRETASSREKCALFMHVIGKQGREIYEELDISEVESHDYNTLCQKFNEHCDPKTNINYERHVFFESYQNEQNFEKFLGSLKIKAKNCEFGSLKNSLILIQLIRGLNDGQMREKLLSKATLTLEEASGWCRAAERAGEQAAACSSRQTCVSNTVEYMQSRYKCMRNKTTLRNVSNPIRDQDRQRTTHDFRYKRDEKSMNVGYHTRNKLRGNNNNCNKCNLGHGVRVKCPAYAVKCYRCDKVSHYAKCCRARFAREVLDADGTGNGIHDEEDCSEHSDVDNADTLSRSATQKGQDDLSDKVMIHENMTFENVEASMDMLQRIKKETHNDPVMIALGEYYQKGWPFNKKQVSELVKPYWNVHNELHMIRGVLFRNNRIVIPLSLRKEMLRRIHEGHLGVEKCQRRARDVMWWPGMSADITCVVQGCDTCQRHQAAASRQPLAPHPVPTLPWEHLAADIFEFGGKQYLLIVDYYSKFVEISLLTNLQSKTVINVMKGIFSRFGIPKKIVTDNGTQFTSDDFKIFSKAWGFEHVTSSPHYPRSNGLAERNVRTVKSILIKSHETGEDWQLALLNFRNTPITGEKYSPAQLLMSRRLNTRLPVHQDVLRPKTVNARLVKENRLKKCDKVKEYYNKGTKPLTSLKPGETVRMRDKKTWEKAKVMARARGERSYWLETKNGRVLRRNRQHIMKLPTKLTALDRRCKAKTHQRNVSKQLDWDDFKDTETNLLPHGTSERSPPPVNERFSPIYITRSGRVVRRPERFEINN
ncbi:unnamed protein product [Parnassius mnemosyne]|uniref:RNA-directed DNA polymerase n=1 Tax=Parnassius mnemosyne TaxID=213953 RepID=A0AAV1KLE7_9NEOP